ncbi:MAG: M48 family metalloprotease [Acidobacteria bacterium]|nr:M48 family metalloprotease [Acidobacteriota bacterium]
MTSRVAALVMTIALLPAIASAQTKIEPGWNLFSTNDDVQIGQQSAAQAEAQLPILNDSQVTDYVNRIGAKLAANAGGPNFPYRFKVVNASDINAFALPGGPIYVNRGVLDQAKNEGEVAGVLAHEIAHVALRHGTHQASKSYGAQAGISILGGLLGGKIGQNTANILNTVGGIGLNALFLKYSRDLETQADVRGSQILAASGYSPVDMVNFFHTLESVDKSKKTNWLSDHPAPPDRVARIQKESQLLKVSANPTTNVAELNTVKNRLRGMGNAPVMGQIAGTTANTSSTARPSRGGTTSAINVEAPSSTMRTYAPPSGVYQISYPSNWRVYQQGNLAATIAPEGGVGDINGKSEVVYGAILNHYSPFNSGSRSYLRGTTGSSNVTLQNATNDLLGQITQSSPHLKLVSSSGQQFNLDGRTALAASLRGTNPNTGIQERVTVVTRQLGDEHLVYLLFITPEKDASRYSPVLQAMVNSMRVDETQRH